MPFGCFASLVHHQSKFNITKSENGFIQYQDHLGELVLPVPSILGDHQLYNISTSIAASRKIFNIKDEHVTNGIKNISLRGRLEEIKSGKLKAIAGNNRLFVDGGHNISAGNSIAKWVKNQNEEVNLIVGMMIDKEHIEFIKAFRNNVNSITLIDIPHQEGSISKEDLKKKLDNLKLNLKLSNGIEESIKSLSKNENTIILCLGSLYLAGEVLSLN